MTHPGQPGQPGQPSQPSQPGQPGQPGQPSPWSDPTTVDPYAPYAAPAVSPYAPQPAAQPVQPYAPMPGYELPAAQPYPTAYPAYGYPVAVAEPTNGLAIAALVVSIIGGVGLCFYGLGGYLGIVGAVLGHVATRQIRERGGQGAGMAKAGVIVGWIATAIAVLATAAIIIFVWWASNQPPSTFD
jgi:uncharacterized protein DUF4190